jgi:hypothetical protein
MKPDPRVTDGSAGMSTATGGISGSALGRAMFLAGMQDQFNKRLAAKTQAIESDYRQRTNSINLDVRKWRSFQTDLEKAKDVVTGALERLHGIRGLVDSTIKTVNGARLDPNVATQAEGYRATFDSYLKSIRSRAQSTDDVPNLLGDSGERQLQVPVSVHGASIGIAQSYLGTGYRITDSDGFVWAPDYDGGLLRRYDAYPDEPTSLGGNLAQGVRLDAIAGNSVTFTIAPGTAGAGTFSGTLSGEGIGLPDAWYYDRLATADGRNRALADTASAKAAVDAEIHRLQGFFTTIEFQEQRATAVLHDLRDQSNALLLAQAKDTTAAQEEIQRQLNLVSGALAHSQAIGQQYTQMFGQFEKTGHGFTRVEGKTFAARIFSAFIDVGV